jgi:Domain of unknown function (DUF4402)
MAQCRIFLDPFQKTLFWSLVLLKVLFPNVAHAQVLSNESPIIFGSLVVGGAGTVTIPPTADSRVSTGGVVLVTSSFPSRGYVDIAYTPNAQIVITAPGAIALAGPSTPSLSVTIDGGTIQTIPPGGTLRVYFGGTLTFASAAASGVTSAIVPIQIDPL